MEYAWHSLFARNMFIQTKERSRLINHIPQFTVINTPRFHALPELDGTNSESYIIVSFGKKLILIGGTSYAGEIKKSIFTLLNYLKVVLDLASKFSKNFEKFSPDVSRKVREAGPRAR